MLKRAEGYLKKEELEPAKVEILRAQEADPRNMYVHAYVERILFLEEERRRHREAEETLRRKAEEEQKRAEAERKRRQEEAFTRKVQQEAARRAPAGPAKNGTSVPRNHTEDLEEYKRAINAAWERGKPTADSVRHLTELRTTLAITIEEHAFLENSARRESYIRALKAILTSTDVSADGPSNIRALHRQFGVSAGEFDALEFSLLKELRPVNNRPSLLVLDDDEELLSAMTGLLQHHGFETVAFTTSDKAYEYLLHHTPDMILADINLESSSTGGFSFFQKIQEIPRLARLPFLFVSGLTDDVIQRKGKELGVDDYVTKPFAGETLISIVKGKLRRYSEMKKIHLN